MPERRGGLKQGKR